MQRRILAGDRLIAAFLIGCALFNYPLLSIFDRNAEIFDLPLLYVYVFAVWGLVIALMAVSVERGGS